MHSVSHTFFILTTRRRSQQRSMVLKFIVLSTFFVLANAGNLITTHYTAPVAYAAPVTKIATPVAVPTVTKIAAPVLVKPAEDDYDPHPQYTYSYDVQDSLTGDNKQHLETRDGDNVRGSYSFIEADGSRRIVEYTADPVNGFDVVIHKVPAEAPLPVAPIAKVAAAPVLKAAPLVHTPPITYSSPLTKIATPTHA